MPPTGNTQSASLNQSIAGPQIKNNKSVTLTKFGSGYSISMQNIDTHGITYDVAVDIDSAVKLASDYFAD